MSAGIQFLVVLWTTSWLCTSAFMPGRGAVHRFKHPSRVNSCRLYSSSANKGNEGGVDDELGPMFEAASPDVDGDDGFESVESLFGGMQGVEYLEDYDTNEAEADGDCGKNPDVVSATEGDKLIENSGVSLIDDSRLIPNPNLPHLITSPASPLNSNSQGGKKTMKMCLMPFDRPIFEGAREFLYLYEKKYRTMMDDIENRARIDGEELLGHCFINLDSGCIGKIGTMCQIVEKKRLRSGKTFLIIEAVSRFKITRILKRSPYLVAEVELNYQDEEVLKEKEVRNVQQLALEVYELLKTYLRIARLQDCDNQLLTVNPGIRDTKPSPNALLFNVGSSDSDGDDQRTSSLSLNESILRNLQTRNLLFSFECASLLSTESDIMQQLLQSKSTSYRLRGLKSILSEAIQELSYILMDDNLITVEALTELETQSRRRDDDDSDLMPPKDYSGISIESELSDITESGMLLDELENEGDLDDDDDDDDFIVRGADSAMEGGMDDVMGLEGHFRSDTIDKDTGFININIASSMDGFDALSSQREVGEVIASATNAYDDNGVNSYSSGSKVAGINTSARSENGTIEVSKLIDDESIWSSNNDQAFQ